MEETSINLEAAALGAKLFREFGPAARNPLRSRSREALEATARVVETVDSCRLAAAILDLEPATIRMRMTQARRLGITTWGRASGAQEVAA